MSELAPQYYLAQLRSSTCASILDLLYINMNILRIGKGQTTTYKYRQYQVQFRSSNEPSGTGNYKPESIDILILRIERSRGKVSTRKQCFRPEQYRPFRKDPSKRAATTT